MWRSGMVIGLAWGIVMGSWGVSGQVPAEPNSRAQSQVGTQPQTQMGAPPATRSILTNIEAAMDKEIAEFTLDKVPLEKAVQQIRTAANTNIVVNWSAMKTAGIARDAAVSLRLRKLPAEQLVRALCETLSSDEVRLNYVVGEGVVEITTNENLGKAHVTRLIDAGKALTPPLVADERSAREKKVLALAQAELRRVGERSEGANRQLLIKGDYLVATLSPRGVLHVQRLFNALAGPMKPGSVPPGVVASVRQKKAEEGMRKRVDAAQDKNRAVEEIAWNLEKAAPELNIVLLASARKELQMHVIGALDYLVNEAGVVYIGTARDIRSRTLFAVYDLRDLIKRLQLKPENKNVETRVLAEKIVATLKEKVTPQLWTDVENGPCSLTLHGGLLVVYAPPPVFRTIGVTWQELEK